MIMNSSSSNNNKYYVDFTAWPPQQVEEPPNILSPIEPTPIDVQLANYDALLFEQGKFPVNRQNVINKFGQASARAVQTDSESGLEYVEEEEFMIIITFSPSLTINED